MNALDVAIKSVALHAPYAPNWAAAKALLQGAAEKPEARSARPQNTVLAPTERRRAPDTVAIALYLAETACAEAGISPQTLCSVFASCYGDLAISDYMCDTLASAPNMISPTKFHNSVHNAAVGYWTIGTNCMRASTALCANQATFAEALLETAVQVQSSQEPVLLVCYDIEARGPMAEVCASPIAMGHALVLSPEPLGGEARLQLSIADSALPGLPTNVLRDWHPGHPLTQSLDLFAAFVQPAPAALSFPLSSGRQLHVQVQP
ncbi:hypothetical protein C7S18_17875 [Ahniella affigens]|uniref:Beta-ketoacyl synthase-like N-terminal domain-containing protein n=1 Tax=Ahniella affigens TaxID=2021234 RepID=A0A2P1PVT2_9GAMM|nr:beta-ketoacyl synthase chain length factor [Ahniella affigens]AVP98932.1 hypothetical protein C7S18_17875 [Ahniella affigens]